MSQKRIPKEKTRLHPRNRNRERYDLDALTTVDPELKKHVIFNKFGKETLDFANPAAVRLLNGALLHHYYGIKRWEFPDENLCPPIPGRADYVHHMADVLGENNFGTVPTGNKITCLDVGIGASCIYPIIGVTEYGWNFIGSEIDSKSIAAAQHIIDANPSLVGKVHCKLQPDPKSVFHGVIRKEDKIDVTLCNPPFHSSLEAAQKGTQRKIKNLTGKKVRNPELNFSGIGHELICDGGEYTFIRNMVRESEKFSMNCYWFSTLVSKKSNLKGIYRSLDKIDTVQIKEIPLGTGNKSGRIVAWTFLSSEAQKEWRETRWNTLA